MRRRGQATFCTFRRVRPRRRGRRRRRPTRRCSLQATEIRYDYTNNTRLRGRQRSDLLPRLDHRSGRSDLRSKDQAPASARQRPARPKRTARSPTGNSSTSPTIIATGSSIHCGSKPSTTRVLPPPAPTASRAPTRSCRTASTPPASLARTIRKSRRFGRSRPRGSSTTAARR